ncbi:MAG: DNA topology modulation protein FlaR [Oscillospiraceae bacterium]|nr:DNA topology modulation protein FlaR [Oscillospiraceae bacterium]
MKIAIMGFSGCGKSTLARKLGEQYGLPVLHMDSIHFEENWVEKPRERELAEVRDFLDSHSDGWVIDGNYGALERERRLEEADRIILLELNRFVCLWRILKRWLTYKGSTRPDMAAGCKEKVDWEFIRWVLHDGRTAKKKADYDRIAAQYPEKVIRIKSIKQQKSFLRSMEVSK